MCTRERSSASASNTAPSIEDVKAEFDKLKAKDAERKAKLAARVKRWIENHPEVYAERKKLYNLKRSEVRRAKNVAENVALSQ